MATNPMTPDVVLDRLRALGERGADFSLSRGGTVRLRAEGNSVVVDRPGVQPITRGELGVALEVNPLRRVSDLPGGRLHGPSYIFALLRDPRIRSAEEPHPTWPIAVEDAVRAQEALDSAKAEATDRLRLRDAAAARAHLRGAPLRELARSMAVSPETIAQIMIRADFRLFRVQAWCGAPRGAQAMLDALAPIGEVVAVSSFGLVDGGICPGLLAIDVPARHQDDARSEVIEALSIALGIEPGYEIEATEIDKGQAGGVTRRAS